MQKFLSYFTKIVPLFICGAFMLSVIGCAGLSDGLKTASSVVSAVSSVSGSDMPKTGTKTPFEGVWQRDSEYGHEFRGNNYLTTKTYANDPKKINKYRGTFTYDSEYIYYTQTSYWSDNRWVTHKPFSPTKVPYKTISPTEYLSDMGMSSPYKKVKN
ncbi:MAG: hypothetical protein FWF00_05830 [Endomicrobia bacterium]|nr:hypothetical protein [Endomicrobiia bacterium]MCL2507185.1 hypothetical protein [Endomicrobiia bacterium]